MAIMFDNKNLQAGDTIQVRVTPKAAANRLVIDGDVVRIYVTVVPEDGKANQAVLKILAEYLGVAKSRLKVVKGLKARDKVVALL